VLRSRGKGGVIVVELDKGGDKGMGQAKGISETWAKDQNCSLALDEEVG
jgi:hypothetical protein